MFRSRGVNYNFILENGPGGLSERAFTEIYGIVDRFRGMKSLSLATANVGRVQHCSDAKYVVIMIIVQILFKNLLSEYTTTKHNFSEWSWSGAKLSKYNV